MHNTPGNPSDNEIINRIISGDIDAFEQILTRYKGFLMGIVSRHVPYDQVEETAHDAFIRAYLSLPSFKQKSEFRHWLSSIAIRACYDFWRQRYRSKEVPMSSLTEKHHEWLENVMADSSNREFHEHGSIKEVREILDWALAKLSAEDRMVLELVYLEGMTVKEAAELLGWTTANVKVRSFRSRKKLQKLLSGQIEGGMVQ
ncbi:MAG TPA: RNA polymerase sigma factor [Syntrophales bacterium]|nr:RNA polymerase sigma factor [Syntrophales bacterium]HPQ45396.1 RNA polymerase sigma factor [Syntrophales bacterium]